MFKYLQANKDIFRNVSYWSSLCGPC